MSFTKKIVISTLSANLLACGISNQSSNNTLERIDHTYNNEHELQKHSHFTSPGKPTIPIELDYKILSTPKVGEMLEIEVNIRSKTQNPKPVSAKLNYAEKLQPAFNPQKSQSMQFYAPNTKTTIKPQKLSIIPQEEGLHFVKIHASTVIDGEIQYRSFGIPIEVGEVDWEGHLKPQGEIKNDSSGGKVIVLDPN